MSAKFRDDNRGFALVEILIAATIITVSLVGVSSLISLAGRQSVRAEDDREATELLSSVKTCVISLGETALRSVWSGTYVPLWFGNANSECLTWSAFTGSIPTSAPRIRLKTIWSATGSLIDREYSAYFSISTEGLPENAVEGTVTVDNGTVKKSLDFRTDW